MGGFSYLPSSLLRKMNAVFWEYYKVVVTSQAGFNYGDIHPKMEKYKLECL